MRIENTFSLFYYFEHSRFRNMSKISATYLPRTLTEVKLTLLTLTMADKDYKHGGSITARGLSQSENGSYFSLPLTYIWAMNQVLEKREYHITIPLLTFFLSFLNHFS